jgi:hypothetical protein
VRQVRYCVGFCLLVLLSSSLPAQTAERPTPALSDYFPPPEEQDMVQSEVAPPIVAGVCDPGVPRTTGLTEASYNTRPIAARAEKPACYPKTDTFEPGEWAGKRIVPASYDDPSIGKVQHFRRPPRCRRAVNRERAANSGASRDGIWHQLSARCTIKSCDCNDSFDYSGAQA